MKKLTLIIAVLVTAFSANAQSSYLIDFAGTGASTTVDSVLAENLSNQEKVKLNGTDILKLNLVTGIDDLTKAGQLELVNFPNPFVGETRISFYSEKNENATITITNVAGQTIAQLASDIQIGKNNFNFSAAAAGVYFVTVTTATGNYSKKVVCSTSTNSKNSFEFVGTEAAKIEEYKQTKQIVQKQLRNAQATKEMNYTEGDVIKFTGYSHAITGPLVTIMNDVPYGSKTESFTFIVCMDADSNHYPVVKIGGQYWMAENLKTKTYSNGDTIAHAPDTTSWQQGYDGVYSTFTDVGVTNPGPKDGYLYNWFAASHPSDLSPKGWHVPVYDEWIELRDFINFDGFDGQDGNAIKSTTGWDTYDGGKNGNGMDIYGFNALPVGDIWIYGDYSERGTFAYFWANEEAGAGSAYLSTVENFDPRFWIGYGPQISGLSIRCVKNP